MQLYDHFIQYGDLYHHRECRYLFFFIHLLCRYDLYLSFEESIFGGQREIEVQHTVTCDDCGGTGAKSSSCLKSCTFCGGRGGVVETQKTPFGIMSQVLQFSNDSLNNSK